MMKILKRILPVLLIVGMLLCAGCAPSGDNVARAEEPPRNDTMVDLIGKTKDEVLTFLSLEETDLTEFSLDTYKTPLEITYVGVKMHLLLQFGPIENVLNGITYMAEYQGEPERAAKEMLAVAKEIQGVFGTPDVGNNAPVWEMTESDIATAITKKNLSKEHTWFMEGPASNFMEDYINKLAETPLYKGYQEMNMKPGYRCNLLASAYTEEGEDTPTAYLLLVYNIGAVKAS